jgi:VWFA-related protein
MSRVLRSALLIPAIAIAIAASSARAQQQPFRTATRLVEVHVVVTDRSKKLVEGLTRDDFLVTEDGVPQTVSIFELRDTRVAGELPAPAVRDAPGISVSNQASGGAGARTVLLLDRANAAFDSQWFARRDVDAYLSRMRSGESVALYVLDGGGMRVLHDFSSDAPSLRRALDVYQARVTGLYEASMEPPADTGADLATVWIVDPSTAVSDFFNRQRWRTTFDSLRVLASHLSGVAGRKNVVWVSEVSPIPKTDFSEFMEEMRKTTRALNDAQASLYPVDARGLMGAISYTRGRPSFTTLSAVRGNQETMEVVAEDTGGRAFMNTNALDVSIARAVDDSRLTYVLGYYPADAKADGRFRTIDVQVKRKGCWSATAAATSALRRRSTRRRGTPRCARRSKVRWPPPGLGCPRALSTTRWTRRSRSPCASIRQRSPRFLHPWTSSLRRSCEQERARSSSVPPRQPTRSRWR